MVYLIICIVAVLVSGVTLFSGFGLGTVLMPAFALFFPVPVAIAATAIVHLANNLFKLALVGRSANWRIALKFSLPAAIAAVAGASLLNVFAALPMIASHSMVGIVAAATAAAFAGAYFGARLIGKVTLRAIQLTVAVAMMIVGFGLATGLI